MNCKLGGELWGCNVPIAGLMVIGMDIYRDKVGGRSVAGIVTTLNGTFGKYWSQVSDRLVDKAPVYRVHLLFYLKYHNSGGVREQGRQEGLYG